MREQNEPADTSQPYAPEAPTVVLSPSAELPPLSQEELAVLRKVGQEWAPRLRQPQPSLDAIPLDPTLGWRPGPPTTSRFGRFAAVDMFQAELPDQLIARGAAEPTSRLGRVARATRRMLLGPPLSSAAVVQERMRKLVGLPVLSSDLLSSVAYGPEAMLTVLVLAGTAALGYSLPLAAVLIVMMLTIGTSYRQTIAAYPHGAGSYIVACDNLGRLPGLTAGASLMMDYILTVSVSVSAGVHAITSALPGLDPFRVPIGLLVIAIVLVGNLRGVRAAGYIFAAPTYAFLLAIGLVLVVGLSQAAGRDFQPLPPPPVAPVEGLGLLLLLRALSSGATSMTGIEAVSNAVPAFRPVEWRNARAALTWMISLLVVAFAGVVLMFHLNGIVPRPEETMLSQLARQTLSSGPLYGFVQIATTVILLLAANTAFNDFPRLLFFLARDCHAPRSFLHMGDRLAFSNGIIALAVSAAVIYVAFSGRTEPLIPLFAVGVFLAFALSQAGMVVHWRRRRGERHWRRKLVINGAGATLSAVVLVTAAISKFTAGAWVVVIAVPALVLLCLRIRRHYDTVARALALHPQTRPPPVAQPTTAQPPAAQPPPARLAGAQPAAPGRAGMDAAPDGAGPDGTGGTEPVPADSPQEVGHLVVVPLARLDLAALHALAYAASLGQPMFAVHISPDEEEDDRFRQQWETWGNHLRLEIIVSPYRTIMAPLISYVQALHALRPDITLTVVLPELVVRRRWHRVLHSGTPRRLRAALRHLPGIVVTSVPVQTPG
ncbi:MAG TPA: APC family permease [Micromonosporaceae bacterium]|nr:APC family permease [Micromonosporaceae bacterium]